jgi:rhodanese-related sulfurtransferase
MSGTPRFRWTLRRALAALALGLGALAIAGDPVRGRVVPVDTQELASGLAGAGDRLTPRELADWIIRKRADYRLLDLRAPEAYAAYHIPTAENVPVGALLEAGLTRDQRLVLVGDDGLATAQAWLLLHAQGFVAVRPLDGGLQAWKDQVLYPVVPADSSAAVGEAFARDVAVARWFGGAPRQAGPAGTLLAATAAAPVVPPVMVPSMPAGAPPPAKKKKEGC